MKPSITTRAAATSTRRQRRSRGRRWSGRISRTIRACRSSRSPTSSAAMHLSRASTPIPASRPRSCCCRSASPARRFSRNRGRSRVRPRHRRFPCLRRDASGRRTRRACTRTSSRMGATRRPSPAQAAGSACGATWRSPGGATTPRPTLALISSICAIPGRAVSGPPPTSPAVRSQIGSRRRSISTRLRSVAAIRTSRRSSRSPCRRRMTWRCGA